MQVLGSLPCLGTSVRMDKFTYYIYHRNSSLFKLPTFNLGDNK